MPPGLLLPVVGVSTGGGGRVTAALCRCVSLYAAVCGGCGAALGLLWLVGHLYVLTHTLDPELRTHKWGNVCSGWEMVLFISLFAAFWKIFNITILRQCSQ